MPLSTQDDILTEAGQRAAYDNLVNRHEGMLRRIHGFLVRTLYSAEISECYHGTELQRVLCWTSMPFSCLERILPSTTPIALINGGQAIVIAAASAFETCRSTAHTQA